MKTMHIAVLAVAFLSSAAVAQSSHYVAGHTTQSGTYVAPHYQTNPNTTQTDNWSSKPNVNPYTGQAGTKDPYAAPSSSWNRPKPKSPY